MKIKKLYAACGLSGYYNKDYEAVKEGRDSDGLVSIGKPLTRGFDSIIQPGHSISILLQLDDGQLAWGDCVDVVFSGSSGRDRIFLPQEHLNIIENEISKFFEGKTISFFRDLDNELDHFKVNGKRLHSAVRFGLSQAILDAVAKANHITITEVICNEYKLTLPHKMVPLAGCTLTEQKINVDRMILKELDYLPHASFTHVEQHFGLNGEKLLDYACWVRDRIKKIGRIGYNPTLNFDVYGTMGQAFNNHIPTILEYLKILSDCCKPYNVIVESPIIAETQEEQLYLFKELRTAIKKQKLDVPIVVNEWCNTFEDIKLFADSQACDIIHINLNSLGILNKAIEAVLYCKGENIGAYITSSTNGTDQSARISSHISLATQADMMLTSPGQGVDEGIMITYNEMTRTLKLIER